MKRYELMFIINPILTEEAREAAIEKACDILKASGGNILKADKWGERKLAYPIDKKKTGFYVLVTFEIEGTALTEVERKLNIVEEIMRYILVKQDD
ncbi:MAG: 30S ribosomal protein S6 [Fusobacteriaceae bacterium]|jgi:small subunit ribosomal protein S6|nr:30S ribosomal protein S6 [Fusobacteriaceae bacterium]